MPRSPRSSLLCALALLSAPAAGQVVFVRRTATGQNTGQSWADAFTDLRAALLVTSSGEIWVAAGTYPPESPNGSQQSSFALRSGVAVYGGFAGTETARDQRAPAARPTILSGDLNGDDQPNWGGMQDNSDHVVTAVDVDHTAVLDGFTIRSGYVVNGGGAGIQLVNSSATFRQCIVTTNVASFGWGGGVAISGGGQPTFTECSLTGNYAHLARGGGMVVGDLCTVTLLRCRLIDNRCTGAGWDANGGAIYTDLGSRLFATDCVFRGNSAEYLGVGTMYPASGGAIAGLADRTELTTCRFLQNRSDAGGAVYFYRGQNRLVSCLFNQNQAVNQSPSGGFGGALVNGFSAVTDLDGCTLHGNTASEDAGGIWADSTTGTCRLVNCIAWNNRDVFQLVSESQLKGTRQHHCCVMNMLVPRPGEDPIDPAKFQQCTDRDPQFVDPRGPDHIPGTEDDDLSLLGTSPCVDAGDPAMRSAALDLGGNLRLADGNLDGVLRTDMGAHEFAHGRLTVSVVPSGSGRAVRADFAGQAGLVALLLLGVPGVPVVVPPFGALWIDPPTLLVLPAGPVPAALTLPAPSGAFDLMLQGVVVGGLAVALINPVALSLR